MKYRIYFFNISRSQNAYPPPTHTGGWVGRVHSINALQLEEKGSSNAFFLPPFGDVERGKIMKELKATVNCQCAALCTKFRNLTKKKTTENPLSVIIIGEFLRFCFGNRRGNLKLQNSEWRISAPAAPLSKSSDRTPFPAFCAALASPPPRTVT